VAFVRGISCRLAPSRNREVRLSLQHVPEATRWRRGAAASALVGLVIQFLAAPLPARADVRTEARQHFRRGMALIQEHRVDDGIAELEVAYEILPHPNVLYNIALAHVEGGRYEIARDYLIRYLDAEPPDRDEVATYLAAVETRISAQSAPTATPVAGETVRAVVAPISEDDARRDIATLEDAATQIEALAESVQSDALRDRAARLREMARDRREGFEGASGRAPAEGEPSEGEPGTTEPGTIGEGAAGGATGAAGGAAPDPRAAPEQGRLRAGDTYEETIVAASRAAESPLDAPNSTTIVTAQDLRLSGLPNGSWAHALRRVAGVSFMHTDPGAPQATIRGLNGRLANRLVVLVDGRSLYSDFLGVTFYDLLPIGAEDIERIEVIRGPASALYGADTFTGVVNLVMREPGTARSYVTTSFGDGPFARVRGTMHGRDGHLRYRASAGYVRAGQYSRLAVPGSETVEPFQRDPDLGLERLDVSGEASLRLDGGYVLRAGGALGLGEFTFQGVALLRNLVVRDARSSQVFASAETPWGLQARVFWNSLRIQLGFPWSPPGSTVSDQISTGLLDIESFDVLDGEVIYRARFGLGDWNNDVIAGLAYRLKDIRWGWVDGGAQTQHHGGVFLQDTMQIAEAVQIVLSARADLHPLAGPQFSPRGSIVVHPSAGQSIRLSGAAAYRSPSLTESYVSTNAELSPLRGLTLHGLGDTSLLPERIVSVELGYMNQMSDVFALELNGYYNIVFDLIDLTRLDVYRARDRVTNPAAAYDSVNRSYPVGTIQYENQPEQYQQVGGELGVRVFPIDGLDVYGNYSLHYTLPFGGLPGTLHDDARTSAHTVNAGVQYRSPFGLDVGVDFSWQSDQTWAEPIERGYELFHLPAYTTLNARIGLRLLGDQLELAVVGTNLVDDGHREHPFGQRIPRRFFGSATVRF
jgi:outer membrane receptor for ferrienterochelin and colicin